MPTGAAGEVEVDQGKHEVRLSKIFQWYAVDFGSSSRERLQYLLPFLPQAPQQALRAMLDSGKAIKVKYNPYDWTVNTTDS